MTTERLENGYKEHFSVAPDQSSTTQRLCVIMTIADCERGFSQLELIKTPLSDCIGQESLNHAIQLSINSDDDMDVFDFENTKKNSASWKNGIVMICVYSIILLKDNNTVLIAC